MLNWVMLGVGIDSQGNVNISDSSNNRIRIVFPNGTITTIAGNGNSGFSGDEGPATFASLQIPLGIAIDSVGNVFIADADNNRIRKVSSTGIITTIAGNGTA